MKIDNLINAKFFIVYLYGVFILNIISIFYMDRASNSLDNRIEFWTTLILPVFIAIIFTSKRSKLSVKQIIISLAGLFIGGSVVFFVHVTLTL